MRSLGVVTAAILIVQFPLRVSGQSAEATPAEPDPIESLIQSAGDQRTLRFPIGRTGSGSLIWALAQPEAMDAASLRQRRLIVAGLDGSDDSAQAALATFTRLSRANDSNAAYACIPVGDPDRWGQEKAAGASPLPSLKFPPGGTAYNDPETREAHFVWRLIGWFAPDVVIEIHASDAPEWQQVRQGARPADAAWPADSLAAAVRQHAVAGIGTAFSVRAPASAEIFTAGGALPESDLQQSYLRGGEPLVGTEERSPLRQAVQQRRHRTSVEVAQQLSQHYGDQLKTVTYQPALALVARLRLGELTGNEVHRHDVERIVARYVDGTTPTLPERANGSLLAGHLIFAELARLSDGPRQIALVRRAADFGFDEQGEMLEAMPFHSEMSDAVFMSCPILTATARESGKERYLVMAARHLAFMQGLCLRADGLYRHSPLCEAAWGRGNGFPALGLALSLADLEAMPASPARDALRGTMLEALRQHLRALAKHQDVTGMWRQVIDDTGSYREMTATCMITYAMVRGIRSGWLDQEEFGPAARRAWEAIKGRVGEDGVLLDVCTGTGKQQTLQDYWNRTAILDRDERGGAMALMAAVEMAAWEADAAGR